MINDLSRPQPRLRRLTLVSSMILLTLPASALARKASPRAPGSPLSLALIYTTCGPRRQYATRRKGVTVW
jgi:hypothetical protein